ncbi:phage protein [Yersinia intermedia]|uniref:phage protein n=1 Tax=Yersinia intermedia TaxID=631 RepID=UPI0005AC96DF|nr:phage protein [Yersinia intermedia]AJJ17946.1 putative single-stranded DNA binding protein [Yersinia intermedia]
MGHTITIKLQKPAREFAAGDSIGFGIRGGVRYYDRKSQKNEFTNYQAVIFAKEGKQAEFYREVLMEGAIVEVFGESIKVDVYDGQNGQSITLELNNARLGFIEAGNKQGKPQQQDSGKNSAPQNHQQWGQQHAQGQQQATHQSSEPPMDFDDDIPF